MLTKEVKSPRLLKISNSTSFIANELNEAFLKQLKTVIGFNKRGINEN